MWPWEHAILAYLVYSVSLHLYIRDSPDAFEAIAVAFASVLPDVIDKTLAWGLGVVDTGYAVGHSIFFTVLIASCVVFISRSMGRLRTGSAFAVGYSLHAPGDILHHYATNGTIPFELMLWPVMQFDPSGHTRGFLGNFLHLFGHYIEQFTSGVPSTYVLIQVGILLLAILVWLYDGAPVLRESIAALDDRTR